MSHPDELSNTNDSGWLGTAQEFEELFGATKEFWNDLNNTDEVGMEALHPSSNTVDSENASSIQTNQQGAAVDIAICKQSINSQPPSQVGELPSTAMNGFDEHFSDDTFLQDANHGQPASYDPESFGQMPASPYFLSVESESASTYAPSPLLSNTRFQHRRSVSEPPLGIPMTLPSNATSGPAMIFTRNDHFLGTPIDHQKLRRMKSLPKDRQQRYHPYARKMKGAASSRNMQQDHLGMQRAHTQSHMSSFPHHVPRSAPIQQRQMHQPIPQYINQSPPETQWGPSRVCTPKENTPVPQTPIEFSNSNIDPALGASSIPVAIEMWPVEVKPMTDTPQQPGKKHRRVSGKRNGSKTSSGGKLVVGMTEAELRSLISEAVEQTMKGRVRGVVVKAVQEAMSGTDSQKEDVSVNIGDGDSLAIPIVDQMVKGDTRS